MRCIFPCCLLAAVALGAPPAQRATSSGPVTTTRVTATAAHGNVTVFASIPYGAPPVGALRFAAPAPVAPWSAAKDVSALPPSCLQLKLTDALYAGAEDCLYLSVSVPDACAAPGSACPVMVWVYGGAFILGDEEEFGFYDAANLAASRGVIVVAPQYRLGPFGFTALEALRAEDAGHSTGNGAMQDQVAALRWTRDNAAAFGGDKERVTIFGESAGGFSICWLLVSQAAAGLFHRAIMESGSCDSPQFFVPLAAAVNFSLAYAGSLGCPVVPAGSDDSATLACLRALPAATVLEAIPDWWSPCWPLPAAKCVTGTDGSRAAVRARAVAALGAALQRGAGAVPSPALPALSPLFPWGPAIDGAASGLRDMPLALIRAGSFNNVPMVLGTNKNEGSIFVPIFTLVVPGASFPPRDEDIPAMLRAALRMYNSSNVDAATQFILDFYPKSAYPPGADNFWRATDLITHFFFSCGTRRTARALALQGADVYLYQLNYNLSFAGGLAYALLGDFHSSELPFVFANEWPPLIGTFTPADRALSDAVQTLWSNLAATGSPNQGAPPPVAWPKYSTAADQNLVLAPPPLMRVESHLLSLKCDAWDEVGTILTKGAR